MNKLKSSPARRYSLARNVLLFVVLMTVLNGLLYLLDSDSYYVCSIFLAYYLLEPDLFGLVIPLLILAVYVAAYFLSKRRGAWLIVGTVLFLLDTLVVLGFLILFIEETSVLFSLGLDLVVHIVADVLLILGVKNRKVALMSDDELLKANTAAGAVEAALEGDTGAQGNSPEIECTVSVSDNGKPNGFLKQGFIRFEPYEAVVGAQSTAGAVLVGTLLASVKEAARFGYGSVTAMSFTNKRQTGLRLDLSDGRIICFVFPGKAPTERFLSLMQRQGVEVPERTV